VTKSNGYQPTRGIVPKGRHTMLEIIELEEKIGHRLNRRRLDMTKTGSIYRPTKKRLIAARKRLAQRDKTRGSKEERALYRLELYREFQDLRDQVNKVFVAHVTPDQERRYNLLYQKKNK
jgi:hypothetical protein